MQPLCQECVCVAVHWQLTMFWLRLSLGDKKWFVCNVCLTVNTIVKLDRVYADVADRIAWSFW